MTNALKMAKTVQTIPDNLGLNPRKDRMLTKVITYCKKMSKNEITVLATNPLFQAAQSALEIHYMLCGWKVGILVVS
jgi:hypothetical protein